MKTESGQPFPSLSRRQLLRLATAASAAGATSWTLASGDKPAFPTKPVRVIVPFAAGGATDVLARAVCDKLGQQIGQPSIVDNRPGAAGLLACDAVAKAAPDGHTLTLGTTSTMLSNQFMFKKLSYDPQKDLVPVVRICWAPIVLVVNSKLAARSLPELMAHAKANKGQLTYGSYGIGSQGHLALATLSKVTDSDMTHIAYKGEAPMVQDLVGGQLMIGIGSILSLKQHIDSGKLRAIAFTGRTRVPALPDVPTFAELGHQQDAFTVSGWLGVAATGGTPAAVVDQLGAQIRKTLQTREVNARVLMAGFVPLTDDSPQKYQADWKRELPIWKQLLQDAGVQPT
ncbi:Bug family tripartite tricarboxylate transporter substrate binding protein [Comamonas odontotermitis]|uniref:Bug family tripartite tricarboxylate transporter substrate binding protein n=1 Tax=Comamonas odontotermitis TaxID=379895 RepID=UPI001CC4B203|nr:tripartite tricarboxylate transporter substrate binding protein [Comamonas odontotermitis]UBB18414.1 tripartite tricarboxylate transporter substrate binding protein [Comamonas odontotermitis]